MFMFAQTIKAAPKSILHKIVIHTQIQLNDNYMHANTNTLTQVHTNL